MKIEYERTAAKSYMVIRDAIFPHERYEQMMQVKNRIPSLLPIEVIAENGEDVYWYEITGLVSLDVIMSMEELNFGWVQAIVQGVCDLKMNLERYLLEETDICFDTEAILVDRAEKKLSFCMIPGYKGQAHDGLSLLFEEVLAHLDHLDMQAVQSAYAIYDKSLAGSIGIPELMQCLQSAKEDISYHVSKKTAESMVADRPLSLFWDKEAKEAEDRSDHFEDLNMFEEPDVKYPITDPAGKRKKKTRRMKEKKTEWKAKEWGKREKPDKRVRAKAVKRRKRVDHKRPAETWLDNPSGLFSDGSDEYAGYKEPYDYEQEEGTTLLAQERRDCPLRLIYCGRGEEQDLSVDRSPFLIGKKSAKADGCLNSKAVSRIHAQIRKEGESYFLEDMNSKNGTSLNGELMAYHTPKQLQAYDRILFAGEEYKVMFQR